MNSIKFVTSLPGEEEFYDLFNTTNWNEDYRLEAPELFQALKNSWFMVSAYHGEQLVGFGRMICDGVVHALILDMIVEPEFQGKGIGREILSRLVEKCRQHRIRDIQLFSVIGKSGFYRKQGFSERKQGAPGMEIKLFQGKSRDFFRNENNLSC